MAALLQLASVNLVTLANQLSPDQLGWMGEVGASLSVEQFNQLTARAAQRTDTGVRSDGDRRC